MYMKLVKRYQLYPMSINWLDVLPKIVTAHMSQEHVV